MARVLCPVTQVSMVTVVGDITTRWVMRMHDVLGYCTFPVPLVSAVPGTLPSHVPGILPRNVPGILPSGRPYPGLLLLYFLFVSLLGIVQWILTLSLLVAPLVLPT